MAGFIMHSYPDEPYFDFYFVNKPKHGGSMTPNQILDGLPKKFKYITKDDDECWRVHEEEPTHKDRDGDWKSPGGWECLESLFPEIEGDEYTIYGRSSNITKIDWREEKSVPNRFKAEDFELRNDPIDGAIVLRLKDRANSCLIFIDPDGYLRRATSFLWHDQESRRNIKTDSWGRIIDKETDTRGPCK